MHRHGYKGRKFGRKRDQRAALLRSLSRSLILEGQIETTVEKAKELRPFVEPLVTEAKKGTLASRRRLLSRLQDKQAVNKLIHEVVEATKDRSSGYLRIEKTRTRTGDHAQLATISFIDEIPQKEEA